MRIRLIALTLGLAVVIAACGSISGTPSVPTSSATTGAGTTPALGEQRSEDASITVVASWLVTGTPALRVVMDTHSVDLDGFDLATLARVRIDGGPWVAPSAWDAPKGGHHREGTLAFAAMDRASLDTAKLIELEMRDIAVPSRMLQWARSQ